MNGKCGTLVEVYRAEGSRQRWLVRVDGNLQPLAIKTLNLRHAQQPTQHSTTLENPQAISSPKARLDTIYGPQSALRITDLPGALAAGHRSLVLGGFHVERILTRTKSTGPPPLLFARCRVCGASFPWQDGGEQEAKRRRRTLSCGHWLFDLAFEFDLELRDAMQPSSAAEVAIRDQNGVFFGITPQAAASNPTELDTAQGLLAGLLTYDGQANSMTVLVSSYPRDALVACETGIAPGDT